MEDIGNVWKSAKEQLKLQQDEAKQVRYIWHVYMYMYVNTWLVMELSACTFLLKCTQAVLRYL